jgi:gamma-glutamyl:cysteine ligase YbdK (ATP-grasp superfamily)
MNYKTLEVLGPEHEFSIVNEQLTPLSISDVLIKQISGQIKNSISFPDFVLSKELQKHVIELKAITPFHSPKIFEETMYNAVVTVLDIFEKKNFKLLGLGMHPTLSLHEAKVLNHEDREVYEAFDTIFGIKQHGWINIQSYQLNVPFQDEAEAIKLYNVLAKILPYIPAISSASPIYESKIGEYVDNRLFFYRINQAKIPSITGEIIPEPIDSFETYYNLTIRKYSRDLLNAKAPDCLINKEWINSRGAIFRFDRNAVEIRIMDEQECIKSDVALSCFIRALLRGLMISETNEYEIFNRPRSKLIKDLNIIIRHGLNAQINHDKFKTARDICRYLYKIAYENASKEEKNYLWIIKKRIEKGNLSEIISKKVHERARNTDFNEAIVTTYTELTENLRRNNICF